MVSESPVWVRTDPGLVTRHSLPPCNELPGSCLLSQDSRPGGLGGKGATVSQETPGPEEEMLFTRLGALWGQGAQEG